MPSFRVIVAAYPGAPGRKTTPPAIAPQKPKEGWGVGGEVPFPPTFSHGATSTTQSGSVMIEAMCSVVVIAAISGASPPIARAMT